ncbi:MAG: YceI family protein [Woeseia sp.]
MNYEPPAPARPTVMARHLIRSAFISACLFMAVPSVAAVTPALYGIDSARSWVRVLVYRGGLLSKLGHNHVVTHRNIQGCLRMETPIYGSQLVAELDVSEFLIDGKDERDAAGSEFPGSVPPQDIAATRGNMLGPALLDAEQHPRIRLTAASLTGTFPQLQMAATAHVQARQVPITVPLTLQLQDNRVIASGSIPIDHKQLGLRPFTAALGTLRVRNVMQLQFNVVSQRLEKSEETSDCERALAVVDNHNPAVFDQTSK